MFKTFIFRGVKLGDKFLWIRFICNFIYKSNHGRVTWQFTHVISILKKIKIALKRKTL